VKYGLHTGIFDMAIHICVMGYCKEPATVFLKFLFANPTTCPRGLLRCYCFECIIQNRDDLKWYKDYGGAIELSQDEYEEAIIAETMES
jgi:hypothetical protein